LRIPEELWCGMGNSGWVLLLAEALLTAALGLGDGECAVPGGCTVVASLFFDLEGVAVAQAAALVVHSLGALLAREVAAWDEVPVSVVSADVAADANLAGFWGFLDWGI
jgi:hypothetical protein